MSNRIPISYKRASETSKVEFFRNNPTLTHFSPPPTPPERYRELSPVACRVLRWRLPEGYAGPDGSRAPRYTKPSSQPGLRQTLTKSDLFSTLKSNAKGKEKYQSRVILQLRNISHTSFTIMWRPDLTF